MLNVRKALACLRQLRIGRTVECGWIADGSSDPTKCAIGVCIGVQASRTGIVLRIAGLHARTRQPVTIDKLVRRINWRLSADVVRLILGSALLPTKVMTNMRQILANIRDQRNGVDVPAILFSVRPTTLPTLPVR